MVMTMMFGLSWKSSGLLNSEGGGNTLSVMLQWLPDFAVWEAMDGILKGVNINMEQYLQQCRWPNIGFYRTMKIINLQ